MAGSLYRCAILTVCSLAVWGCGGSSGGGNAGGGGSDHDPIKVTVPDTVIDYGDRVTVSWSGKDLLTMDTDRVSGTNFAIGREQTSGSISDRPAADTTYRIEGLTKSDRPAIGEVTVRVRKSSKSFLIVGSETDPLVPEIVQELKGITTGPVSRGVKIPSTPIAAVIVILDSGEFAQADEPKVRSLLAQDGRLLLVGRSVRTLAGAVNEDDRDLSSIRSWFGAGTSYSNFGGCDVMDTAADLPLSLVEIGRTNGGGPDGTVIDMDLDPRVVSVWQDEVKRVAAFAFAPPIGGRVAHLGALSFGESETHQIMRSIFLAECRWLADYL